MKRRSTTVSLDDDLIAAVEVAAARSGKSRAEIIEDAIRSRLATEDIVRAVRARIGDGDLSEQESLDMAYEELKAMRGERRARKGAS